RTGREDPKSHKAPHWTGSFKNCTCSASTTSTASRRAPLASNAWLASSTTSSIVTRLASTLTKPDTNPPGWANTPAPGSAQVSRNPSVVMLTSVVTGKRPLRAITSPGWAAPSAAVKPTSSETTKVGLARQSPATPTVKDG